MFGAFWVSAAFGITIGLGLFFLVAISLACVFSGLYSHNLFTWIGLIRIRTRKPMSTMIRSVWTTAVVFTSIRTEQTQD
jgi:uncharacterized membrane protein YhiD involved in acid resistance